MSATLVARNLAAAHGDRTLFADLDLVVAPGDVIGLVGANGAGKSTLLRVLAGITASDAETVREFLARRTGVTAADEAMQAAAHALADGTAGADDDYARTLDRWLALGG